MKKDKQKQEFKNPVPVIVLIVKSLKGILVIKRRTTPVDGLALVSGYVDEKESVEEAGRRELFEETGINYKGSFSLKGIESSSDKNKLLIFLELDELIPMNQTMGLKPNREVSEFIWTKESLLLCFGTHQKYLDNKLKE